MKTEADSARDLQIKLAWDFQVEYGRYAGPPPDEDYARIGVCAFRPNDEDAARVMADYTYRAMIFAAKAVDAGEGNQLNGLLPEGFVLPSSDDLMAITEGGE